MLHLTLIAPSFKDWHLAPTQVPARSTHLKRTLP